MKACLPVPEELPSKVTEQKRCWGMWRPWTSRCGLPFQTKQCYYFITHTLQRRGRNWNLRLRSDSARGATCDTDLRFPAGRSPRPVNRLPVHWVLPVFSLLEIDLLLIFWWTLAVTLTLFSSTKIRKTITSLLEIAQGKELAPLIFQHSVWLDYYSTFLAPILLALLYSRCPHGLRTA